MASDFEFVAVMVLVVITFLKPSSCLISLYYIDQCESLDQKEIWIWDSHVREILARENDARAVRQCCAFVSSESCRVENERKGHTM